MVRFGIKLSGTFGSRPTIRLSQVGLVLLAGLALGQGLQAQEAWVNPVSAQTAYVYLRLLNPTAEVLRIVAVESPAAAQVQIWEGPQVRSPNPKSLVATTVLGKHQLKALEVPSGGRLELKPGGLYLCLLGLRQPLAEGQRIPLTLKLADGSRLEVSAVVRTQ